MPPTPSHRRRDHLEEAEQAYDIFAAPAETGAVKVVLDGTAVSATTDAREEAMAGRPA